MNFIGAGSMVGENNRARRFTMRWKQFFTPVQSMNAEEARAFLSERTLQEVTILDVR